MFHSFLSFVFCFVLFCFFFCYSLFLLSSFLNFFSLPLPLFSALLSFVMFFMACLTTLFFDLPSQYVSVLYILVSSGHITTRKNDLFTTTGLSFLLLAFLTACAGVDTPVFIRKGVRFLRGLVKEKRENVVTVLTESSDEEKDIVIYGQGTQHYIMVEDILPSPRHVFLGTRVIAKHVRTGKYTFARIDAINGDKYSVTFEDKQVTEGIVAVESIRNLYPPTFCGR